MKAEEALRWWNSESRNRCQQNRGERLVRALSLSKRFVHKPSLIRFHLLQAFRRQINHVSRLKCRVRNIPAILRCKIQMVDGVIGGEVRCSQIVVALHGKNLYVGIFHHGLTQSSGRIGKSGYRRAPIPLLKARVLSKGVVRHVRLVAQFATKVVMKRRSVRRQNRRLSRIVLRRVQQSFRIRAGETPIQSTYAEFLVDQQEVREFVRHQSADLPGRALLC